MQFFRAVNRGIASSIPALLAHGPRSWCHRHSQKKTGTEADMKPKPVHNQAAPKYPDGQVIGVTCTTPEAINPSLHIGTDLAWNLC